MSDNNTTPTHTIDPQTGAVKPAPIPATPSGRSLRRNGRGWRFFVDTDSGRVFCWNLTQEHYDLLSSAAAELQAERTTLEARAQERDENGNPLLTDEQVNELSLQAFERSREKFVDFLAATICTWTLHDIDGPLPLSRQSISEFPNDFTFELCQKISQKGRLGIGDQDF